MGNLTAIIAADTTGFRRSVEQAKHILEDFAQAEGEAAERLREVSNVSDSQITAFNRVVRTMNKVANGSMSTAQAERALSAQVRELRIQYANLSDTARNSDFGRSVQQSCENAERYLGQLRQQLEQVRDETEDASEATDESALSFGKITEFVKKYAVQLGVASAALKVMKDAFFSSEDNIDTWGRTVSAADSAYRVFCTSLNSGNWSNFFKNLNSAIGGAIELYNTLDRLGSIKTNNEAAIAIVESELANLRLLKQQGKNVDAEIKAKTDELNRLKGQEVEQGKKAGIDTIVQAIKTQNGNIADELAYAIAEKILSKGQDAYDYFDSEIARLEKKAGTKTITKTVGTTSFGTAYNVTETVMAVENLTDEERLLYEAYKAAHQAETKSAEGIKQYASAIRDESQAARQTFEYNGWTGASGGNSKSNDKKNGFNLKINPINIGRTEAQIKEDIKKLQTKIDNTPEGALRIKLIAEREELEKELQNFGKNPIRAKMDAQASNLDLSNLPTSVSSKSKGSAYNNIQDLVGASEQLYTTWNKISQSWDDMNGAEQFFAISDAIFSTIDAISQFVNGFSQLIELLNTFRSVSSAASAAKIAQNNAEAASNATVMATESGKAIAGATASGAKLPFPANIAAIAAGVAAVVAALAMIGSFAGGGIVQGKTTIGDMNIARVNSGEMILNKGQQANLFKALESGRIESAAIGSGEVSFRIHGKDLVGVLSSYNKKIGKVL